MRTLSLVTRTGARPADTSSKERHVPSNRSDCDLALHLIGSRHGEPTGHSGQWTLLVCDPCGHLSSQGVLGRLEGQDIASYYDAAFEDANGLLPHQPGYRGHIGSVPDEAGELVDLPVRRDPEDLAA